MKCELNHIVVHYEIRGEGRPLLMLHGALLDHRQMMTDMEPIFAERPGWQRLYLDLPGHGQTPAVPWISTQAHVLQVISDFVDQMIPTQRFVVAGMSWGGYLALGLLHQRGEQIDGAFLNVCTPIRSYEQRTCPAPVCLAQAPEALAAAKKLGPSAVEFLNEQPVQNQAVLTWWLNNAQPAEQLVNGPFCEALFFKPENNQLPFAVNPLPQPFLAPTLILVGKQDTSVGWRDQWALMDSYPRATFVALDRAGHLAMVHQRPLFNALVSEWLERVDEYRTA